MDEKKHIYETDVMALPPLRMVLGEVPSPDPVRQRKVGNQAHKSNREIRDLVTRIIVHLKEKD